MIGRSNVVLFMDGETARDKRLMFLNYMPRVWIQSSTLAYIFEWTDCAQDEAFTKARAKYMQSLGGSPPALITVTPLAKQKSTSK